MKNNKAGFFRLLYGYFSSLQSPPVLTQPIFIVSSRHPETGRFDPSATGLKNDRFIGLPFTEEEARIVILSLPWDVTTSYRAGTSASHANVLRASSQLDLEDPDVPQAWKMGLFLRPPHPDVIALNEEFRPKAEAYIDFLEQGGHPDTNAALHQQLENINMACGNLHLAVQEASTRLLEAGKAVGLLGGEHSAPFGLIEALAKKHDSFGILQIDAHMDLREAYQGFAFSHASIFHNVLQIPHVSRLVQVGIRDWCEEEIEVAEKEGDRVQVFFDHQLRREQYAGRTWAQQVKQIIQALPQEVYISFDIDGLDPRYCPHTGTPVPGGLDFQEAVFLLAQVVESGRTIIGFDLCEVAGEGEWDGNVGARLLYKLANLMGKSQALI